ncbi:MAG: hypothetical protein ACR2GK_00345 [Gemmatimonadaceae bacterium]
MSDVERDVPERPNDRCLTMPAPRGGNHDGRDAFRQVNQGVKPSTAENAKNAERATSPLVPKVSKEIMFDLQQAEGSMSG